MATLRTVQRREIKVKNSLSATVALLSCVMVATAADVPRYEAFVGYTYVRANSATDVPAFSANGGGGQCSYNFNQWLGVVADLGAVHSGNIGGLMVDTTTVNFLFGPRISLRYPHLRPFFQLLWGGTYATSSVQVSLLPAAPPGANPGQPVSARIGAQQTAFAMTAGGGLDIEINKHVSFRPIALEYYMTRFQNLRSQSDNNQNNLRYAAGFNFTFGAR